MSCFSIVVPNAHTRNAGSKRAKNTALARESTTARLVNVGSKK
jgi:hypothetical protein